MQGRHAPKNVFEMRPNPCMLHIENATAHSTFHTGTLASNRPSVSNSPGREFVLPRTPDISRKQLRLPRIASNGSREGEEEVERGHSEGQKDED